MHRIRMAVRENRLTSTVLTEADYVAAIERHGRGWVAEEDGKVVGFAVGDARDGNIWALFVDPAHEHRGHGRRLHDAMVSWLWSRGLDRLWLTTDPATRARAFYERAGWRCVGSAARGEARYELRRMPSIDRATRDDAPSILALQKLAYMSEAGIYGDYAIPPLTQTLVELEGEFARKVVLKAVEGPGLVGSVRGFADGGVAHLERLIVHPDHQGRGIGSALVARLEASFPDVDRFALFTGHRSERNIALYSRLGYREVRREPIHPGLELVHMEKRRA